MSPKEISFLLSEDIHTNNGFIVECTIRELLILEGLNPDEKRIKKSIKGLIKQIFYELKERLALGDSNTIIDILETHYNINDITQNIVRDVTLAYINRKKDDGGGYPDPSKVSKSLEGSCQADAKQRREDWANRRDDSLDT
jgi:hypothetical protein